MIRALNKADHNSAINIVNENWRSVYSGYVNPALLSDDGCRKRALDMKNDFTSQRFEEYVWEENGRAAALLSLGKTEDTDKPGAYELWRIYIAPEMQGKGIGGKLLNFAEEKAKQKGYTEMLIWAFRENTRAIKFYQKRGFQIDKIEFLKEPGVILQMCFTSSTKLSPITA